jgi:tRNA-dihydrouridine synthase 1
MMCFAFFDFFSDRMQIEENKEQENTVPVPSVPRVMGPPNKLKGYDFYKKVLGSSKYVVAPMVDMSELPWRMLCRGYGADLCYTPMMHSKVFMDIVASNRSNLYMEEFVANCPQDRPLIAQFCGNDPQTVLSAAMFMVQKGFVDAVDLNLGCPQQIAKRGHYGAFLMDEWEVIEKIIRTLDENVPVPVTAKIRVFDDLEKTIQYAKMVQNAGAQLVTVHGRTREQRGSVSGLANWDYIKAVKEALDVPVFSNGNILYFEDVEKCLEYTKCDGVMSAETNLYNPCLFAPALGSYKNGITLKPSSDSQTSQEFFKLITDDHRYPLLREHPPCHLIALEYLDHCLILLPTVNEKCRRNIWSSCIKSHVFKILRPVLNVYPEMAPILGKCKGPEKFKEAILELCEQLETDILNPPEKLKTWSWDWLTTEGIVLKDTTESGTEVHGGRYRMLPYWVCQPFIRGPQKEEDLTSAITNEKEDFKENVKAEGESKVLDSEAKRKEVERLREKRKQARAEQKSSLAEKKRKTKFGLVCTNCNTEASRSCKFILCKRCCRERCSRAIFDYLEKQGLAPLSASFYPDGSNGDSVVTSAHITSCSKEILDECNCPPHALKPVSAHFYRLSHQTASEKGS